MKAQRKCKGCGWVFPSSYTSSKCKFCKTEFEVQYCRKCGALVPTRELRRFKTGSLDKLCKACHSIEQILYDKEHPEATKKRYGAFIGRHEAAAQELFDTLMMTVPTFEVLTEDEWLSTCSYFNGCAICGDEHIESREFFVPFQIGGRYAAWNMIPLCGSCATKLRKVQNPFRWIDKRLGTAKQMGLDDERRDRLVDFISMKIKEANNGK